MYFVFLRNILQHSGVTNDDCALRELRWLPISERVVYKLCFLVHKASLGQSPDYVTNLFRQLPPSYPSPHCHPTNKLENSESRAWNQLPTVLKRTQSRSAFLPKTENVSFQPYVLFQITHDNDYVMCPRS